jgi:hypothetical protein
MLHSISALYNKVGFAVKFPEGVSEEFSCNMGVRQGCPLSPFLFGVFVEMLHDKIMEKAPTIGAQLDYLLPQVVIALLMYADDIVLMAESPDHLQLLLDVLEEFCVEQQMVVNLQKTRIVVFNDSARARNQYGPLSLRIGDQVVEVESEYKYLGMLLQHKNIIPNLIAAAIRRGQQAVAVLYRRAAQLGVHSNVDIKLKLYNAIVLPNLTYGCEVWGPWFLNSDIVRKSFEHPLEQVRLAFYRTMLRVRRGTPGWCLYRELGEYPMQLYVARQVLLFANKLRAMPAGTWARQAMLDAWLEHRQGNQNWWTQVVNFCTELGLEPAVAGDEHVWPCYSVSECVLAIMEKCHSVFLGAELGSKVSTYHQHFGMKMSDGSMPPTSWDKAPYLRMALASDRVCKLARFRLSSHYLAVETGRWSRVSQQSRICTKCQLGVVQDEHHAVFVCPALHDIRRELPVLFDNPAITDLRSMFCFPTTHGDRWRDVMKGIVRFLIASKCVDKD